MKQRLFVILTCLVFLAVQGLAGTGALRQEEASTMSAQSSIREKPGVIQVRPRM